MCKSHSGTRYWIITGLIMLVSAIAAVSGFAYYASSVLPKSEVVLDNACRMVDPISISNNIGGVEASSRVICGVNRPRSADAIAVRRGAYMGIAQLDKPARVFDSASDTSNVFVLFQVRDASSCGYHYEIIHVSLEDMKNIGVIASCSPLVRLTVSNNYVSLLVPSDDLRKGFIQAYSYNFKAQKWVTS